METAESVVQNPLALAEDAAKALARETGVARHDVAIVLGSGWDAVADALGKKTSDIAVADLPGFLPPAVDGHAGRVQSVLSGNGRRLLVFRGRTHLYEMDQEGRPVTIEAAVHRVRTAAAAGCSTIILTSAVGGLNPLWEDGQAVIVEDHLSQFVPSPLRGPTFQQCHAVYDPALIAKCRTAELTLPRAVLAQVRGPHFESPAEARALRTLGAQIVGMSVVIEAIAAIERGMKVLGISIVTDQAGTPTSHDDVLAVVRATTAEIAPKLAAAIALF